jgi:hypothetical protein
MSGSFDIRDKIAWQEFPKTQIYRPLQETVSDQKIRNNLFSRFGFLTFRDDHHG